MSETMALHIMKWAMTTGLEVAAPILLVALVSGTIISIVLAATQVQEYTLSFVPKIVAIAIAAVVFGPWMLQVLVRFSVGLLTELTHLAR